MYLRSEQLHETDPAIDVDICDQLQPLWRDHAHHQRRALRLDQVDVLGRGEVASLRGGDRGALVGRHDVVAAHVSVRG